MLEHTKRKITYLASTALRHFHFLQSHLIFLIRFFVLISYTIDSRA